MSEPVTLRGGILIIGSLFWDERRQEWRDTRLDMASAEAVTAPIRYGRLSGKRGHTYTMVFSRLCALGHAKVVQCAHSFSSPDELIAEAEFLWKAEQPSAESGRISANWGCVVLLTNPDRNISPDFLTGWANRVRDEAGYGNVPQTQEEGSLISSDGLLLVPWPSLVSGGGSVELDFLLATTNHPTFSGAPPNYPSVATIVNAWNRADDAHVRYFTRNVDCGITTFQDDEIRAQLRPLR